MDVVFDWDSFGWYVYLQFNVVIVVWDFDIKKIEILKCNRDKWMLNEYFWICFDYFVEGWYGDDLGDENYVLILFFYKKKWIEDDFDREQR